MSVMQVIEPELCNCFGLLPNEMVAYFDETGSPFGVEVEDYAIFQTNLLRLSTVTTVAILSTQEAYHLLTQNVAATQPPPQPIAAAYSSSWPSANAAIGGYNTAGVRSWSRARRQTGWRPISRQSHLRRKVVLLSAIGCLALLLLTWANPGGTGEKVTQAIRGLLGGHTTISGSSGGNNSGGGGDGSSGVSGPGSAQLSSQSIKVVSNPGSFYNPIGPVTISLSVFKEFLAEMHSPALSEAETMYAACVELGCDPAVMAAFFEHESSGGRYGAASVTRSVGNIRCSAGYACYNTGSNGSFRQYASWTAGAADWARLLQMYKNDWKLSTLEEIIPHYAPQADHNDEAAYKGSVVRRVDDLRRREALLRKSVGTSTPAVSSTSDSGQSSDTAATNNNSNSVDMPLGCPVWESDWTITQGYSAKHPEIDIARPLTVAFGTNIHTTIGGVVTVVRDDPLFGNRVFVSNGTFTLHFNHLLPDLLLLNGQVVRRGDIVGLMGSTGNSTGPHLDYEIFQGDRRLNPMEWVVRAAPNS